MLEDAFNQKMALRDHVFSVKFRLKLYPLHAVVTTTTTRERDNINNVLQILLYQNIFLPFHARLTSPLIDVLTDDSDECV